MRKRFIVFVDLLENAANLLSFVSQWALQENAEILIIHETFPLIPVLSEVEHKEEFTANINQEAIKQIEVLIKTNTSKKVKVNYIVSEVHFQIKLNELLVENYEQIVVTGLKKMNFIDKYLFKDRALQLLENTKAILVAMPFSVNKYSHENIFVAIPDNENFNHLAFNNFLKFIDPVNTLITFFHLIKPNDNNFEIEKKLSELARLYSKNFKTSFEIYETNNPNRDIKKVINNRIDEILVVQRGSRLLSDQLFRPFLINELVYDGETPLVIIPEL